MSIPAHKEEVSCPITGTNEVEHLLNFPQFPVFQHPMSVNAELDQVRVALDFYYSPVSGHCFQAEYSEELLEKLYSSHYYTPAEGSIGETFRKYFISVLPQYLDKHPKKGEGLNVLEVGSSDGEMLSDLDAFLSDATFLGFEPNSLTSKKSEEKGFEVRDAFFTAETVRGIDTKYDMIFSRHVVEHIPDQTDFFNAAAKVAAPGAYLIHETPCLDWFIKEGKLDPFHVEHIHVFSKASIQALAKKNGWLMVGLELSEAGNMIGFFQKESEAPNALPDILPPNAFNLDKIRGQKQRWLDALSSASEGKELYLWGAGSFGLTVGSLLDGQFEAYLDSNKNKEGLQYAGLNKSIKHGPSLLESRKQDQDKIVIAISSTFSVEIETAIRATGWQGEVIALANI
ncbi:MAG: hypothetical protein COB76_03675 [Alphaproteobacteria bacterium]|nr:MAG: hypothetical protein COB76_03675 [Alphaproteobacteria bacterium]